MALRSCLFSRNRLRGNADKSHVVHSIKPVKISFWARLLQVELRISSLKFCIARILTTTTFQHVWWGWWSYPPRDRQWLWNGQGRLRWRWRPKSCLPIHRRSPKTSGKLDLFCIILYFLTSILHSPFKIDKVVNILFGTFCFKQPVLNINSNLIFLGLP